jgi:hypothetical protein
VTTPPSRLPRSWNGEGEAIWKVPLLRAEGGEKESQFGLVAPKDCRPTEAEASFDCGWALFGNRAAENGGRGDSVY